MLSLLLLFVVTTSLEYFVLMVIYYVRFTINECVVLCGVVVYCVSWVNGLAGSYEGDWKDGRRHGRGVYTSPALVYVPLYKFANFVVIVTSSGMFNALKPQVGTYDSYRVCNRYSGDWCHDEASGRGTLKMVNGYSYQGMWESGVFEGKGQCSYCDGSVYEGSFKLGLRHGRGTLTFPNGAVYKGRFKEDRLEGSGTLVMSKPALCNDGSDTLLVPIEFHGDIEKAHLKAGFTSSGL